MFKGRGERMARELFVLSHRSHGSFREAEICFYSSTEQKTSVGVKPDKSKGTQESFEKLLAGHI